MPLGIKIYSFFIVIDTFLETKGIHNPIKPRWMDWPIHDANVTPTNASEWDLEQCRKDNLKLLLYTVAWYKYTENNHSFFGLIRMLPDKIFMFLCCCSRLPSYQPQGRFFLCEPLEVSGCIHSSFCFFQGCCWMMFLKICFDFTHFLSLSYLKILRPRHQDL